MASFFCVARMFNTLLWVCFGAFRSLRFALSFSPADRPSWSQLQDRLLTLSDSLNSDSARSFCRTHCTPPPPLAVEVELQSPTWEDLPGDG